jgi:hypothetical protein
MELKCKFIGAKLLLFTYPTNPILWGMQSRGTADWLTADLFTTRAIGNGIFRLNLQHPISGLVFGETPRKFPRPKHRIDCRTYHIRLVWGSSP